MMEVLGFMQNIGMQELLVLLIIILFLFGAKRIPDLARAMGRSVKEFKKGRDEAVDDKDEDDDKKAETADAAKKSEPKA